MKYGQFRSVNVLECLLRSVIWDFYTIYDS
jgi:hypothetical protein